MILEDLSLVPSAHNEAFQLLNLLLGVLLPDLQAIDLTPVTIELPVDLLEVFSNHLSPVELEADYRSYGSSAIAHKRAEHSAHKPIDRINLRLVHHVLYCAT